MLSRFVRCGQYLLHGRCAGRSDLHDGVSRKGGYFDKLSSRFVSLGCRFDGLRRKAPGLCRKALGRCTSALGR
jgi:hypothetical protein